MDVEFTLSCYDWFLLQYGYTALHVAALKGHSDTVKLLLGAGAKDIPDKVDKLIHPLSLLCKKRWILSLSLLIVAALSFSLPSMTSGKSYLWNEGMLEWNIVKKKGNMKMPMLKQEVIENSTPFVNTGHTFFRKNAINYCVIQNKDVGIGLSVTSCLIVASPNFNNDTSLHSLWNDFAEILHPVCILVVVTSMHSRVYIWANGHLNLLPNRELLIEHVSMICSTLYIHVMELPPNIMERGQGCCAVSVLLLFLRVVGWWVLVGCCWGWNIH